MHLLQPKDHSVSFASVTTMFDISVIFTSFLVRFWSCGLFLLKDVTIMTNLDVLNKGCKVKTCTKTILQFVRISTWCFKNYR